MSTDKATVTDERVGLVAKAMADSIGHGMREKCIEHAKAVLAALAQAEQPVAVKPIGHISAYGLEKLQTRNHYCVSVSHAAEKEYVIPIYLSHPPAKREAGEAAAPVQDVPGPSDQCDDALVGYGCFDGDVLFSTFVAKACAEEEAKMHEGTEVSPLYRHPSPPDFLHHLVENAFSWGKQDCNYLNPKHVDAFIAATRDGMPPEAAAAWVANGSTTSRKAVQSLSYDEVEQVILQTEPPGMSDRDDQIWTRRMAVALADLFNERLATNPPPQPREAPPQSDALPSPQQREEIR